MDYIYSVTALVTILTILYNIKIKVLIQYKTKDRLVMMFYFFGDLIKYKYLPSPKADIKKVSSDEEEKISSKVEHFFNDFQKVMKIFRNYKSRIRMIIYTTSGKIHLHKINLNAEIGFEDASLAGVLSGAAWGVAGIISSFIINNFKSDGFENNVNIKTLFEKNKFEIDFSCIFSLKLGHIILILIKLMNKFRW